MIGPIEKGISQARLMAPPVGVYEGVDLRTIPKYISFRAALLHNNLTKQYIILILAAAFVLSFILQRVEVYSLYSKLREKEYILAPGVQDFTPASANTVSDSYIAQAVNDFLGKLGNVSSASIDEQYHMLAEFMGPDLKAKFLSEASEWITKVKADNISELLTITDKEIRATTSGQYRVIAMARRDTYINNEYVGHTDEAIEMDMLLVAPSQDRRWYLQVTRLSRQSVNSFNSKTSMRSKRSSK